MGEAEVVTLWGTDRTPYMTRVILGRLRVHVFHRGDTDPDCHDHPADFWTFPLVSYVERFWCSETHCYARRVVKAFWPHFRRAEFAHMVIGAWTGTHSVQPNGFLPDTDERPIATLVWWGKKRREWGFHTNHGWVDWRTYTGMQSNPTTGQDQ